MTQEELISKVNEIAEVEENKEKFDRMVPLLLNGNGELRVAFEICRKGKLRFGEIKRTIPNITGTVLINSLRNLESLGIIERIQYNEVPPHVEYVSTEKGTRLLAVWYELMKWCIDEE